ncbi:hypothetical protein NITHO_3120002 [Nitrolancea hollandica Lb]|uniref:Uncharacterized protein n=1 Tax=Nitrolancea hollandica Lb TaxID=1129897 RepID=I4EHH8_9BACT|nr:hypothetical protein NITHO_3120002 [Nitrolancea hollandica Lb]
MKDYTPVVFTARSIAYNATGSRIFQTNSYINYALRVVAKVTQERSLRATFDHGVRAAGG